VEDSLLIPTAAVLSRRLAAPSPTRCPLAWLASLALLGAPGCASQAPATPVDLIVVNGAVYPGNGAPMAEAVAITGGTILRVGSTAEIQALKTDLTQVIDARQGSVIAGFNDSHVHFREGGESLERVNLFEAGDLASVQAKIRAFAAAHPDRPWVLGRGWLYGSFPGGLPTRAQLDEAVSDRPAMMTCYDGHTTWVNSRALALAGITRATQNPKNGVIVRDPKTGEASGALKEDAQDLVQKVLPKVSRGEKLDALRRAVAEAQRLGVTSVQDAGIEPEDFELFTELERRNELGVRVYAALLAPPGFTEERARQYDEVLRKHPDTPRLKTGAVKLFADGVIEAHTASLLEPYANRDTRGIPNYAVDDMNRIVAMMDARGWQIFVHAIGDAGIRTTLDAYERAAASNPAPARGRRHRIEHIEAISAADIPRFAKLGVIASMQPFHASPIPNVLLVWAVNLGPERASRAWAWKSILDAGGRLTFGTDWPVVDLDPRPGIHTALTRRTLEGKPEGGFGPEQRLPLPTVIDAWTAGPAYASFEEGRKGTLAPGMLADVVVLSRDIFKEPAEKVKDFEVVTTILDGKVVYGRAK
jgi:predicted amidohydrolase YtcJ